MKKKALAGRAAEWVAGSGLFSVLEGLDRGTHRLRIPAYHRVDDLEADPDLDPGLISATPSEFRTHCELIARRYAAISLADLWAALLGERPLPPRAVLLTFDDGYEDFAHNAWPILREFGLPAVLFVPTSFPDTPGPGFWWDRLYYALEHTKRESIDFPGLGELALADAEDRRKAHLALRLHVKTLPHTEAAEKLDTLIGNLADVPSLHRVLGWEALRKLSGEGLDVCSHSHLHGLCTRLSSEELAEDLATSKRIVEAELGHAAAPSAFAYPSGANDGRVRRATQQAGYDLAFGGRRGIDRVPGADPFDLLRMPVRRYGTALFRAQLRPSVAKLGSLLVDGGVRQTN